MSAYYIYLLITFYLSEFYLLSLKQLLKQDGSGNDVVVWFVFISVYLYICISVYLYKQIY